MRTEELKVVEVPEDLLKLPVGTKILTRHHRVFQLDVVETPTLRKDAGTKYWIEPGTLQPFPVEGLDHWFPAFVLPPEAT